MPDEPTDPAAPLTLVDWTQTSGKPMQFAVTLSDGRVDRFLATVTLVDITLTGTLPDGERVYNFNLHAQLRPDR